MLHKKRIFSTTRMIVMGFLVGIILGTILLSLPIASRDGTVTPLVDAMFTATTSICVTGLTTVTTIEHWSLFGQIVILFLIQFGGLGVVTFTTTILLIIGKKITLSDRLLIQDAYNLDTIGGLVKLTKNILFYTVVVEGVGAFIYAFQFVPQYKFLKGIWFSIFHAVSAFCNAGIDLVGNSSFVPYRDNVLMNLTTMALIIIGGIGFPVIRDVVRTTERIKSKELRVREFFAKLTVHSKLVITVTIVLITFGSIVTLLLEFQNPKTIGELSIGNKIMSSVFQSVTTRTAGFAMIPQENFLPATSLVYLVLMFIGGSPSGTAGGVKTVTVAFILISTVSLIKGKKDSEVFRRKIADHYLRKALAVIIVSFSTLLVTTVLLTAVQDSDFLDTIFETTSAIATVGLSRNMTGTLKTAGKLIIMVTMFLGRIGPITLALAFNARKNRGVRTLPEGRFLVG